MKVELKSIYQDLRDGRLTKAEALDRIRILKSKPSSHSGAGAMVATPHWEKSPLSPAGPVAAYESRHILLGGLRHLDPEALALRFSGVRCSRLRGALNEGPAEAYGESALDCFVRIKEILQGKPKGKVLVQIVVPDEPRASLLAGLSGLLRTATLENPLLAGQVILTDAGDDADTLTGQLLEDQNHPQDSLILHREGVRYASAWKEAESQAAREGIAFKEGGTYLITGGLGGLGRIMAGEILGRTRKAKVILTGRSAVNAAVLSALEAMGAPDALEYRRLDVTNQPEVEAFMASLRETGGLDGILHCAGVLHDGLILKQPQEEFLRALAPKVAGTCNLDLAARDLDL
ncbi:MAG TPA: SDR family NAD(P)-dependent oxidoreductase, partial [Fibrobacteria bacterium]|nr:SDR family NAD(P)-dependent oxidoreductase [Fibrobacteria bacterium]